MVEVVILAQGTQSRLGHQRGFKQLLELPACRNAPIMARTIMQVRRLLRGVMRAEDRNEHIKPVVVTWPAVISQMFPWSTSIRFETLPDPGNSSLKGVARYLEVSPASSRVILLGDVVYSWACLEACFQAAESWGFVGTSDLSSSGGELWGVGWRDAHQDPMMVTLRDALLRHPPFDDEYQPGQLRRWISGWRRGDITTHVADFRRNGRYTDVSDYTHDIDIPAHLALLPWLSEMAAEDDAKHGMNWSDG